MAEKPAPVKKRVRFTYNPGAGSSAGGGGGGGDGAAAPAFAPPRVRFTFNPGAGSSAVGGGGDGAAAPPRSPPPPEPFTYNFDDKDFDVGWGSLYLSDLSTYSSDPQNPPHYIGRQNCKPLARQKFLSLRHNWQQLLDGKKTYLRPPKNYRVAKDNYEDSLFVTPKPLRLPVHMKGPLAILVDGSAARPSMQRQYQILSEHYVSFRPIRIDGSQFYRAFLFSYLENLGKMQCNQAEFTRLMECVARSRENFCRLQWNNAYFSNPEAFFSSLVADFEHLVYSILYGINFDDELYARSQLEISSSRKVHIRTHEADYNRVLGQKNALSFCLDSVRPFDAGIGTIQMRALSQALGIPVHVAIVDKSMKGGTLQVRCLDFIPRSESEVSRRSGSLSSFREYYLSSATDKHPVLPAGNLVSSDRMPLVTISMTATTNIVCILYRK